MRRPKIYQRESSRYSIFRRRMTENCPELKKHEFSNWKVHQAHGKVNKSKGTLDIAEINCGASKSMHEKIFRAPDLKKIPTKDDN